jgi:hypothetical protein
MWSDEENTINEEKIEVIFEDITKESIKEIQNLKVFNQKLINKT